MPKIIEMFAFIAVVGEDDEGIIAGVIGGNLYPLVGTDMARVDSLRPIARAAATQRGCAVRLVKFSQMTELEIINPAGRG